MLNTKEYFNNLADKWDVLVKHDVDKIEFLLGILRIKKGSYILDVGCGTGVLTEHLLKRVGSEGKVFGVDFSEKMIEIAKSKFKDFPNVEFIVEDVNSLTFKNYFDYIICYSAFPHFEDKKKVLKQLHKMLKNGGILLIAHSQSRKAINQLHKSLPAPVNNHFLPSVCFIKMIAKEYFFNLRIIDNDEIFAIVLKKKNL
jgi:demethylmenaquinone methyltransferase/2-methoxy-6-polyprenyl-1,4-benzoquinol methylase